MYVPLDLAKKHLNIEEDFKEDDEYILSLIEVAEAAVRVHVNESFADIAKRYGGCIPNPPTPCSITDGIIYKELPKKLSYHLTINT